MLWSSSAFLMARCEDVFDREFFKPRGNCFSSLKKMCLNPFISAILIRFLDVSSASFVHSLQRNRSGHSKEEEKKDEIRLQSESERAREDEKKQKQRKNDWISKNSAEKGKAQNDDRAHHLEAATHATPMPPRMSIRESSAH
jgi:hypothetical protein